MVRDVVIIFVILLVLLIIISAIGGSIRHVAPTVDPRHGSYAYSLAKRDPVAMGAEYEEFAQQQAQKGKKRASPARSSGRISSEDELDMDNGGVDKKLGDKKKEGFTNSKSRGPAFDEDEEYGPRKDKKKEGFANPSASKPKGMTSGGGSRYAPAFDDDDDDGYAVKNKNKETFTNSQKSYDDDEEEDYFDMTKKESFTQKGTGKKKYSSSPAFDEDEDDDSEVPGSGKPAKIESFTEGVNRDHRPSGNNEDKEDDFDYEGELGLKKKETFAETFGEEDIPEFEDGLGVKETVEQEDEESDPNGKNKAPMPAGSEAFENFAPC